MLKNPSKSVQLVLEEPLICQKLILLLENTNLVIRGKGILACYLLISKNPNILQIFAEHKFFINLDKLNSHSFKYVICCLHHLVFFIEELSPSLLKIVQEEFNNLKNVSNEAGNSFQDLSELDLGNKVNLNGNFNILNVIFQICNTQCLKEKVIDQYFLKMIFAYLDYCNNTSPKMVFINY